MLAETCTFLQKMHKNLWKIRSKCWGTQEDIITWYQNQKFQIRCVLERELVNLLINSLPQYPVSVLNKFLHFLYNYVTFFYPLLLILRFLCSQFMETLGYYCSTVKYNTQI